MEFLFRHHEVRDLAQESEVAMPATYETLSRLLQKLDGISAPASAWESDILPGRLPGYDPALLDMLCLSGRVSWGKFFPAAQFSQNGQGKKASRPDSDEVSAARPRAGPVKSTPINLVQRENLSLWGNLAPSDSAVATAMSSDAEEVMAVLGNKGASFFLDIVRETGLLKTRTENALAELVSLGVVTSDSFSGMRALLSAKGKKSRKGGDRKIRRSLYEIEDAGRWTLISNPIVAGNEESEPGKEHGQEKSDETLEKLVSIYLHRWGVINRKVLEQENYSPPWRVLLLKLRRMELQGRVRGGRFIAGIGGEQFALPETVKTLRQCAADIRQQAEDSVTRRLINGTDPLNLVGVILPGRKIARLAKNRILFENGLPVAVLEKDDVHLLRPCLDNELVLYRQTLLNRHYSSYLLAYLGR